MSFRDYYDSGVLDPHREAVHRLILQIAYHRPFSRGLLVEVASTALARRRDFARFSSKQLERIVGAECNKLRLLTVLQARDRLLEVSSEHRQKVNLFLDEV